KDDTTGVSTGDPIKNGDTDVKLTVLSSDFTATGTADDLKVDSYKASGGKAVAEYTIEARVKANKASSTASTLKMKVENSKATPAYSREIEVKVPASGGGVTPTPTKVRGTKRENNIDVPNNDRVYFDINSLTSSSDASIRQTYFADITLRVFDENAPAGLAKDGSDIIKAGNSMDMGSFYFDTRVSTIQVENSMDGYYEVVLTGLRYSGNSNKLSFRTRTDSYIGDVTAEISECITRKEANAESDKNNNSDDDSKLEVETPYVIVSKYSYGGGSVTAGDTFPLSLTFYNTSETEVVGNMMITITMPEGLMLTSSSNTFYVEELDKRGSITKSVQVTAKADAKPQSHNVGVAMKYQYVDDRANARRSAETTENIAIPVVQVDRFQVTAVEIPMEVMLGEETSVTVNFVNKGRSEVYNLSAEIDGNIQNPGQNQNLGNLLSGATGSADFYILPNEAGMCTGEIKLTYEDTNMEEKTATIRYNTNVKSPEDFMGGKGDMGIGGMIPGMGEEMPPVEEKKSTLPIIIIGCVIVAIPVLIVVKKKLDHKRKEREDADL
ncbi:MAG: hypothetical protein RR528_05985, partial [Angelakisella sp.]